MKILTSIKLCLALVLLATPLLVHSWPKKITNIRFTVGNSFAVCYFDSNTTFFQDDQETNCMGIGGKRIQYNLLNDVFPENGIRTSFEVYFYQYDERQSNLFKLSGMDSFYRNVYFAKATIKNINKYRNLVIKDQKEADQIAMDDKSVTCETVGFVSRNGTYPTIYATTDDYNNGGYVRPRISSLKDEEVSMIFDCYLSDLSTDKEKETWD